MAGSVAVRGLTLATSIVALSLTKYADPLLDLLDPTGGHIRWRLFREACCHYDGVYVKDLSKLGRNIGDVMLIDNSPHSYLFQPENAIPIGTFIDDMGDRELEGMLPYLERMRHVEDVRTWIAGGAGLMPPDHHQGGEGEAEGLAVAGGKVGSGLEMQAVSLR